MSDPCNDGECMCSVERRGVWAAGGRADIPTVIDADEFAEALCLCVEKGGKCATPDDCKCEREDVAKPGW